MKEEQKQWRGILGLREQSAIMGRILDEEDEKTQTGPNGRDEALPYVDPFDDGDLLETVLDAEFVERRNEPPVDLLDTTLQMEAHVADCEDCAKFYGATVCAHCLELRICERVIVGERKVIQYYVDARGKICQSSPIPWPLTLQLCRSCRNRTHEGALRLDEERA